MAKGELLAKGAENYIRESALNWIIYGKKGFGRRSE